MEDTRLQQVLEKYLDNNCNPGEVRWLMGHFHTASEDELMRLIMQRFDLDQSTDTGDQPVLSEIYDRIQLQIGKNNRQKKWRRIWPGIAVAASVVIGLSVGIYFIFYKPVSPPSELVQNQKHDIAPGTNGAVLTLANGRKIILEHTKAGVIMQQNGANLQKAGDSLLVYRANNDAKTATMVYNTLETPKGNRYTAVLPDGTKVWLNAASSIRFPTAFTGKQRDVEITGEVYFEVAHNKDKPFHVSALGQTIEVLGTHFNVNAYPEESAIKTTLLEGSVKVTKDGQVAYLKPGQQAWATGNKINVLDNADMDQAVAWKNGFFQINNADIQTIMREAARWYDVDVVYEGEIPVRRFSGRMRMNVNASEFLDMLRYFNLHFKIEGRKIIVTS